MSISAVGTGECHVDPDTGLPAGAVDYRVTITAGEDVLVELTLPHRDKPQQQVAIGLDSFEDLEGDEKFEAIVQISAVGVKDVEPVLSEPFSLEFGATTKDLSTASLLDTAGQVPSSTAASARDRRSIDNGLPIHAGLHPASTVNQISASV